MPVMCGCVRSNCLSVAYFEGPNPYSIFGSKRSNALSAVCAENWMHCAKQMLETFAITTITVESNLG